MDTQTIIHRLRLRAHAAEGAAQRQWADDLRLAITAIQQLERELAMRRVDAVLTSLCDRPGHGGTLYS